MSGRRGFTLIELLIVVLIVATLASLSMSLFQMHDDERLQGAVRIFQADVEWARSASLANPDDPARIHVLEDGSGWYIARTSAALVPLEAADGAPMRRVLGEGLAAAAAGITVTTSPSGTKILEFDPFGGVRSGPTGLSFVLPDSDSECLITFEPGSGSLISTYSNP